MGKLRKRSQARGPVKTWQEMDRAAASQILRTGSKREVSGYQPFRIGNSRKMPAIARYESWKPTEAMADGVRTSWMSSAVERVRSGEQTGGEDGEHGAEAAGARAVPKWPEEP